MPMVAISSEIVNFTLDNRRVEGDNYLVDVIAEIPTDEEWMVSPTTLVIDYNEFAINSVPFDGDDLLNLDPAFAGHDYEIFQTMYNDNYIALNIVSTEINVSLDAGKHTIGSMKFAIVDSTKYDSFDFVNEECIVYNGTTELIENTLYVDSYSLDNPWNKRVKPLLWYPNLQTPIDNAIDIALQTTFNWTDVVTADSYTLQISKNEGFNDSTLVFNESVAISEYYSIAGLLDRNTVYYWRVNAYNNTDTSFWSDVFQFKTLIQLAAPTLISPYDEETGVSVSTSFNWEYVLDGDSYEIEVSDEPSFTDPPIFHDVISGMTTFIPIINVMQYNKTYYWKVRAKKNSGMIGPWSDVFWFTTDSLLPPKLNYPVNAAENLQVDSLILSWENAEYADSYSVEMSRNADFDEYSLIASEIVTDSSYRLPNSILPLNTEYFWRVHSVATNNQKSDISIAEVRSFKTENLLASDLVSPTQSECMVSLTSNFEWNRITNADSYELEIATSSDFIQSNIVYNYAGSDTSIIIPDNEKLNPKSKYYWRVRSKIGAYWYSDWSPHRIFTTEFDIELNSPSDEAVEVARNNPRFTWVDVSFAQNYQIQISKTSQFGPDDIIDSAVTSHNSIYFPYLNHNTRHYWRVRAEICDSWSGWSDVRSFTTENWLMGGLVMPVNNAVDLDVDARLVWIYTPGANNYEIQVSKDNTFVTVDYSLVSNITQIYLPNIDYYNKYYWRVRAVNIYETSEWSDTRAFTTEKAECEWTVNQTGNVHYISIPASISPHFGNRDIENDDYIGVFYNNHGKYECGGFGKWTGSNLTISVYGDDISSTDKDGFFDNEEFYFMFWDAHHGREVLAIPTYTSGPENFENNGQTVLASLEGEGLDQLSISLKQGWNMVSSNVIPENTSLDDVFVDLDYLLLARANNNDIYFPYLNLTSFDTWDVKESYMIYMDQAEDLIIEGSDAVPESIDINLNQGWNAPAYLNNKPAAVSTVLSSIHNNLLILKKGTGEIYFPYLNIMQFTNIVPGMGYKCYMNTADVLTYPANSHLKPIASEPYPKVRHLVTENSSINNFNIIIESRLEDGSEIGAYNQAGDLIGNGIVKGGYAAVTVYGDDSMDEIEFGAKNNELIEFQLYDKRRRKLEILKITDISNFLTKEKLDCVRYETDAILVAKAAVELLPVFENSNLSVLPNPSSDFVQIDFNSKNFESTANLTITIFDLNGKLVREVYRGNIEQQELSFKINLVGLSSGTYTVIANVEGEEEMKKLIIEK
jgi:hypothetical protein